MREILDLPDTRRDFTGLFLPSATPDVSLKLVMAEITGLGLERNAWELDSLGYTILTPDQVAAGDLAVRLRESLLDLSKAETGLRPDVETDGTLAADLTAIGRGQFLNHVLFKDPIFEQALMNRSALALIGYLLGGSCVLSSMNAMLKGRGQEDLELHSDQVGQPEPLPPYAQVANATWVLTDYSPDDGATRFVPGSHKLCRHPTQAEATDSSLAVTISAPAGSIVVWHGNTWHGAAARINPGIRASLIMFFCRWYLMPQALYRQTATAEMLARNPDRFTTLMGKRTPYAGRDSDGVEVEFIRGQSNQFA